MSLRRFRSYSIAATVLAAACDRQPFGDPGVEPQPAEEANLTAQARQVMGGWGVAPILPIAPQNAAVVDLGRMLFFDKILSGNRDVSCATCHNTAFNSGDGQSLAVGTGGVAVGDTRHLGPGRQFTPRNVPSLFNSALGSVYMFWDGRVAEDMGPGRFRAPTGVTLPSGLSNLLAAQAMIPVTNRVEMRGIAGDRDISGNVNELASISDADNAAIWDGAMKRLLAVTGYLQRFNLAYPGVPTSQLGYQHAANAIASFEAQTFTKTNSPFDRFLARDDNALSADAKRGAILFFGRARCSTCHNGALLGGQSFASVGVPQLGPGNGTTAPLDGGREDQFLPASPNGPRFMFRIAPLRNAELTAPYMHNGAYQTLEAVVQHYNNADSALKAFDPSTLDPSLRALYRGDATTIAKIRSTIDGRLQGGLQLSPAEQRHIVAFLKSLTDPSARNMSAIIPASVPSGLPVR